MNKLINYTVYDRDLEKVVEYMKRKDFYNFRKMLNKDLDQEVINELFLLACRIDVVFVNYLLTNRELKFNADIHYNNDLGLSNACEKGEFFSIEIIDFLLTSPSLSQYASLNVNCCEPIRKAILFNNINVLNHIMKNYKNKIVMP